MLNGTAPDHTTPSPPPATSPRHYPIERTEPSRPPDSIDQGFQWPPKFDLDEVDLSSDAHARNFRRPSARTQAPKYERRVEFDDEKSRDSALRYKSVASSIPAGVSTGVVSPRGTATSPKRGTRRERDRWEMLRSAPRWVVVAVGITILLASLVLLTYLLRRPQVAAGSAYVPLLASAASERGALVSLAHAGRR
jgi:hypothetical protein